MAKKSKLSTLVISKELGDFFRDLPRLFVLGVAFTLTTFIVSTLLVWVWDQMIIFTGIPKNKFIQHFSDLLSEKGPEPFLNRIKAIFEDPCGRLMTTISTAVGAAATTQSATMQRSKQQINQWFKDNDKCDQSWDLEEFLNEVTEAMKVSNSGNVEVDLVTAKRLFAAWTALRKNFSNLVGDPNGDFSRLNTLTSIIEAKKPSGNANYSAQLELQYTLQRISIEAKERREKYVEDIENFMKRIKAVDENAISERYEQPEINKNTLILSILFGISTAILLLKLVFS